MAKIFIEIDTKDPATMDLIRKGVRIGTESFKEVADFLDECYDINCGIVPEPYRNAQGEQVILTVGVMVVKDTSETPEMAAERRRQRKEIDQFAEQVEQAITALGTRRAGETLH
jgi:hypothetical protein